LALQLLHGGVHRLERCTDRDFQRRCFRDPRSMSGLRVRSSPAQRTVRPITEPRAATPAIFLFWGGSEDHVLERGSVPALGRLHLRRSIGLLGGPFVAGLLQRPGIAPHAATYRDLTCP